MHNGLRVFGEAGTKSVIKELQQLHEQNFIQPCELPKTSRECSFRLTWMRRWYTCGYMGRCHNFWLKNPLTHIINTCALWRMNPPCSWVCDRPCMELSWGSPKHCTNGGSQPIHNIHVLLIEWYVDFNKPFYGMLMIWRSPMWSERWLTELYVV